MDTRFGDWRRALARPLVLFSAAMLAACGGGGGGDQAAGSDADLSDLRMAALTLSSPLPGAIWTTGLEEGTSNTCALVDGNIYTDKGAVYLNGGPRRPGAAGLLPNTWYFVKVTQPDGALLGTSSGMGPLADGKVVQTNGAGHFVTCYKLADIVHPPGSATPGYADTGNNGGEYKVWVSTEASFVNSSTKTDNFKVKPTTPPCVTGCTPAPTVTLVISKWYDTNTNGVKDAGEVNIPWRVGYTDGTTAASGTATATFTALASTPITAFEYAPFEASWIPTGAMVNGASHTSTLSATPAPWLNSLQATTPATGTMTIAFGNVCIGAGGGHTLGFWSNKNGQAVFGPMPTALSLLNGLNLTSDFADYAAFRTWLLGATAVNMSYMLSAQLAAMELNVLAYNSGITSFGGFVNGATLIYAPGVQGANAAGFMTVNALMAEANASLGGAAPPAGMTLRAYQELLKNALDDGNNNLNLVQPTPCQATFPPQS